MPIKNKMEDYNTPSTQGVNFCYNYATDNMNKIKPGKKRPIPAMPGAKGDIDPFSTEYDPNTETLSFRITCASLKAACVDVDDMKDEEWCKTHDKCWRVAYFIKKNETRWGDGYHFAREDKKAVPPKDGKPGEPAQWSHKMNGHAATNKKFNCDTKRPEGPPLSDPETQTFAEGYKFCGYICACPDLKVTHMEVSKLIEKGDSKVAMFEYASLSGTILPPLLLDLPEFDKFLTAVLEAPEDAWIDDAGPGNIAYRFEKIDEKGDTVQTVLVSDEALTLWTDDALKHLPDPDATFIRQVKSINWGSEDEQKQ